MSSWSHKRLRKSWKTYVSVAAPVACRSLQKEPFQNVTVTLVQTLDGRLVCQLPLKRLHGHFLSSKIGICYKLASRFLQIKSQTRG